MVEQQLVYNQLVENLGFLLALGAALFWGTYMVPFKLSKSQNCPLYQVYLGLGVFISGLIISIVFGYSLNFNMYGLLSGFLWGLASSIFLTAVPTLGLSKAAPIVAALVIISTFLWGVLVFGEIPSGILTGSIGILIIIGGVILVSTTGDIQGQNTKKGLLAAISSGLIWGSQIAPLKIGHLETQTSFFPMCLGIFVTGLSLAFVRGVKFKREAMGASISSGVIWNIGNLVSLMAIGLIGLSKAFPITQAANLAAVLWGLFYFKEITAKQKMLQVLIGAIILMIGIFILGKA